MRLADRRRLLSFGLREIWRRLCRRSAGFRLAVTSFSMQVPDRLIVAPTDLRALDPFVAEEILEGRFPLAGRILETYGQSPFSVELPSRAAAERLHSFAWLRHIRTNKTEVACASARQVVADWIVLYGRSPKGIAWEAHVAAERVIAWLSHSTVVLQGAEAGFYRRFMKSLAYQVRYLRKIAGCTPEGDTRLRLRIALAMASISMPTRAAYIRREGRRLDRELERQILADGGHVSRNPRAVLDLLIDLLPLRQTYINLGHDLPQKLIPTIDRMYPALRFFRHQDGDLALFNGASSTPASELMSVLRYDETAGKPFKALPHMHYHRLSADGTTLIVDTGRPLSPGLSRGAHAGCLSFEMSAGRHRFIVNCGSPKYAGRNYRHMSRSTPAHSTVTLNETSSSRIIRSRFAGSMLLGGVSDVAVERWDDMHGNDWLRASHDGYVHQFGYFHEREIGLNVKGNKIKGHDRLYLPEGEAADNGPFLAVARFHIHPVITLSRRDEESVAMRAPDGETWIFAAPGLQVMIDEDIFFADVSGVRPSQQLVIEFSPPETSEIRWMLRRGE
ncbi:heparinase II/III family protein [Neorhizobium galegae]|uniref:heparinase II/III family protein n=1 Tax=Neorhizobium galegae TaxID=399 RepID=UPI0006218122|nr:heparinase II/III family protein [Neorhizobium galegae]KAB1120832.1 heparinase [Neorhizobium galegae]MCQ1810065.1 heparinase II/III family protein [Neorhizobium galegae]CDZ62651.1 Heparinase II/III family protein [Neorhizobium galegae bv. orientalis]